MALFIYQNLNSQMERAFPKNVNKKATQFNKTKKVLFFLTVVFCPVIHNICLKRYCVLSFFVFSFTFFLTFGLNLK